MAQALSNRQTPEHSKAVSVESLGDHQLCPHGTAYKRVPLRLRLSHVTLHIEISGLVGLPKKL